MLLLPGDYVDPIEPLDNAHPLNIGLAGEWAVLPNSGLHGGVNLRNLVRDLQHGVLTSGPTWGFDRINFSGASNYINAGGGVPFNVVTGNFTIAVWAAWTGTTNFFPLNKTTGGSTGGYELLFNSGNVKGVAVRTNSSTVVQNTSGTWNDGNWHFVVASRAAGTLSLYVDGVAVASAANSENVNNTSAALQFNARNGSVVGGVTWRGNGWTVYPNRGLTAADVRDLYEETRAGNPNRWNWIGKRKFWLTGEFSTGGGTTPITPSGSCTATGTLALAVSKSLAGSCTATGSLANVAGKLLAGSLTPTGSVTKLAAKGATGSCTGSGSLANQAAKSIAGSTTPTGSLANQAQKPLAGSCTPSGSSSYLKVALLALSGSVTAAGSLVVQVAKALAGSVTGSGALAKQVDKPMAGSTTPSGSLGAIKVVLTTFSGAVTAAGSLVKSVLKYLAGSSTATGDLTTSGGTVQTSGFVHGTAGVRPTVSGRVGASATVSGSVSVTGSP